MNFAHGEVTLFAAFLAVSLIQAAWPMAAANPYGPRRFRPLWDRL